MSLRYLILARRLSTSRNLAVPSLGTEYKSQQLWESRFNCPALNDTSKIKAINTKILSGAELDFIEADTFINIASNRGSDFSALQEATNIVRRLRKSLYAHIVLPSTHHAMCRLFLESNRLSSLLLMLEERIEFGIHPDAFALNLIFDEALKQDQLAIAARAAALVMIQEEFGLHKLTDSFALYSVSKYIESKTNFKDWKLLTLDEDIAFNASADPNALELKKAELESNKAEIDETQDQASDEASEEVSGDQEEEESYEEDEDDAEYHRVPWLRNPYFDDHFDLKNPREICGKTLTMLGTQYEQDKSEDLAVRCHILGNILRGHWSQAQSAIDKALQSKLKFDTSFSDLIQHYMKDLHELKEPDNRTERSIMSGLKKLPQKGRAPKLSDLAESHFEKLRPSVERNDIDWMKKSVNSWSALRFDYLNSMKAVEDKKNLIAEIKEKKEELKRREQYLYFFDNLKKQNLTRIDYN